MLAVAITAVVVALVIAVPGYALLRLVFAREGRLLAAAGAVPVSFGIVYVTALWSEVVGLPITSVTVLAPLVVVAAVCLWRLPRPLRVARPGSVTAWLTIGATCTSFALWAVGLGWPTARPNRDDGLNHSIFTYLIGATDSIDPSKVLVTDVPSGEQAVAYYPLAIHALAAALKPLTGVDAGQAFIVTAVMASVLALPWGIAAVTRELFGRGWAAGVAAIIGVLSTGLVFYSTAWGGYTLIVGMSMAYGVLALVWALVRQAAVGTLAVVALAIAGLAGVHTSELFLVAIVGVVTLVPSIIRRAHRWRIVGALVGAAGLALLLLIPAIADLLGGFSERYGIVSDGEVSASDAFSRSVTLNHESQFILALVVAGVVSAFVRRRARLWALLLLMAVAVYGIGLASDVALLDTATAPWYSASYRLVVNCVWFAVPLAGYGAAVLTAGVLRPLRDEGLRRVTIGGVGVLAATVVAILAVEAIDTVHRGIGGQVADEPEYRAAFDELEGRVGPEERVLNARPDESGWMLPWTGVNPVYGMRFDGLQDGPTWDSRWYLIEHAHEAGRNRVVDELLDEWRIRYVVAGDEIITYADQKHFALMINREAMRKSPEFKVVYDSDPITVFEHVG